MDPLAPSITFFDKDTGKGRVTYIGTLSKNTKKKPRRAKHIVVPLDDGRLDKRGLDRPHAKRAEFASTARVWRESRCAGRLTACVVEGVAHPHSIFEISSKLSFFPLFPLSVFPLQVA
jgi:hypothetical protein